MIEERAKRKLSAILSADVKGYSRLMREDELVTIRTLEDYRVLMTEIIRKYRGRVVDSPGDNVLAEFASVVDAVESAVEIQKDLAAKNAELPENRRMEFRIGINLGDVVEEGERIYGDGVNIAARIEGLAEGGAICVSRTAYGQVKNKLNLGYEYLGEHSVKNIAEPVRVYRVLMEPEAAGKVIGELKPKTKQLRGVAVGAVAVLIIVAGALAIWNFYFRPAFEPASVEKMAFPLPDKPSIAVLPFTNMSGDPKQEYLSDGFTDQIITGLSRLPGVFVIARNSSFTYKGKAVKVQQVAEELGIRYVLEGSFQRSGDSLRITAQLIDAITGHHLWAERYDRDFKDLFAVQDELTVKIMGGIGAKLTMGRRARVAAKGTANLDAHMKLLKGLDYYSQGNEEANRLSRQMFEQAIALDPDYAYAYAMLAWTHMSDVHFGSSRSPRESIKRAAQLGQKALTLDNSLPQATTLVGYILAIKRQYEKAITRCERAVTLAPNASSAHAMLGRVLHYAGSYEESVAYFDKAIRLDPFPPNWYLAGLGAGYQLLEKHEEAVEEFKKVLSRNPDDVITHIRLAATYSLLGQEEEARAEAKEVLRLNPKFSLEDIKRWPYKNQADTELIISALRKAGLK
jgi:adenylate cyclase